MLSQCFGRASNVVALWCAAATVVFLFEVPTLLAQESPAAEAARPAASAEPAKLQSEREAALAKMLSGATLEGSYTSTGGDAAERLRSDKYSLGEVKKINDRMWLIEAKIQYRNSDAVMVPLMLPIEWAGDTPVIVVDNFTIPGMGTFSARVMFFDDHYMGYWKHDDRGGHLFGVVRRPKAEAATAAEPSNK